MGETATTAQPESGPSTAGSPIPPLSVGVLTADLTRLADQIELLGGRGLWAHVDVMDGRFCPSLTVGPAFVRAVAECGVPVDAHLMVHEPSRFVPDLIDAGVAHITVHYESTRHPYRTVSSLVDRARDAHVTTGVAIQPATPVEVLEPVIGMVDLVLLLTIDPGYGGQRMHPGTQQRVEAVRTMLDREGHRAMVGVDGGINFDNLGTVRSWQADLVVCGSAIFTGPTPEANLAAMYRGLTGEAK